jgi:hypothetical protein
MLKWNRIGTPSNENGHYSKNSSIFFCELKIIATFVIENV